MIAQIFVHFLMVLIGVILFLITVIKDFCTFSEIFKIPSLKFHLDNIPFFSYLFITRYKVVSKGQGCSKGAPLLYNANPNFKILMSNECQNSKSDSETSSE